MTFVYLLNESQKDSLVNKKLSENTYFYPIQDINDNWVISQEEVNNCTNEEFLWVKELSLIEYLPKN